MQLLTEKKYVCFSHHTLEYYELPLQTLCTYFMYTAIFHFFFLLCTASSIKVENRYKRKRFFFYVLTFFDLKSYFYVTTLISSYELFGFV